MFEDDGSYCKNIIFGLGGRVEELFDVQKVTDLVLNNWKSVGQPLSARLNRYSGLQRAIYHFTVVCLVAWPLNEGEAGGDLALIETFLLFL